MSQMNEILNPIVSLCYAAASARLYALREDGSIHYRDERNDHSPWRVLPDVIEDLIQPVEQAPPLPSAEGLPPAPQETGLAGMLTPPDASFQPVGSISAPAVPSSQSPEPIIPQK